MVARVTLGIDRRTWGTRALRGVACLALALALAGCVTVAPHERGRLARPGMSLSSPPGLRYGEEHSRGYREGATGGGTAQGGGCGCN